MNKNKTVLIALLPEKSDWYIANTEKWYRIRTDTKNLPINIKDGSSEYIAFYHNSKFDEELKWKVVKYARIKRILVVKRADLFPNEPQNSKKAYRSYYKIEFDELLDLHQPFIAREQRRILFVPTSEDKFFSGSSNFNTLFHNSPLEDNMVRIMEAMDVHFEREWMEYVDTKKHYYLDFAIWCEKGEIDIECDGDEFHMNNSAVHRDKTRNNELESYGWKVLRYTTKHFMEEKEHIEKTVYNTIKELGGAVVLDKKAEYLPIKPNKKNQLNLFQKPKS
jgi:very-short-patch-repair endonuclease